MAGQKRIWSTRGAPSILETLICSATTRTSPTIWSQICCVCGIIYICEATRSDTRSAALTRLHLGCWNLGGRRKSYCSRRIDFRVAFEWEQILVRIYLVLFLVVASYWSCYDLWGDLQFWFGAIIVVCSTILFVSTLDALFYNIFIQIITLIILVGFVLFTLLNNGVLLLWESSLFESVIKGAISDWNNPAFIQIFMVKRAGHGLVYERMVENLIFWVSRVTLDPIETPLRALITQTQHWHIGKLALQIEYVSTQILRAMRHPTLTFPLAQVWLIVDAVVAKFLRRDSLRKWSTHVGIDRSHQSEVFFCISLFRRFKCAGRARKGQAHHKV